MSYYTLTSTNRIHCDNYFFNHGLRTPGESFFPKIWNFWSWADKLGIWGIFGQAISTMLALWVPCPWESVAGSLSYKKLWFLLRFSITIIDEWEMHFMKSMHLIITWDDSLKALNSFFLLHFSSVLYSYYYWCMRNALHEEHLIKSWDDSLNLCIK